MPFVPPALPLFLLLSTALESLRKHRESRRPPPGTLISLSNRRRVHIRYHSTLQLSDTPCVIFEAGANSWSPVWQQVSTQLSTFIRTFSYDRPGLGFSDATPLPRTPKIIANDLLNVLRVADVNGPYILVAHSLGALYTNAMLKLLSRDQVLGVVYVDAASIESVQMLSSVVPQKAFPKWLAKLLACLGILRFVAPLLLRPYVQAFKSFKNEVQATWARADWLVTYTREWSDFEGGGGEGEEGWLGDLPIVVLVPDVYERTRGKGFVEDWQRRVGKFSKRAKVVKVDECGHFVQVEQPNVVVRAVREVWELAVQQKSVKV